MRWLLKYSAKIRGSILLVTLLGLLRVAFSMLFVYSAKQVIDVATAVSDESFLCWVIVLSGSMIFEVLLSSIVVSVEKLSGTRLQILLRHTLFERLINLVWLGREKHHSGDKMNRVERDVRELSEFVSTDFPTLLVTIVQFVAAFVFLLILDSRLAWVVVGLFPLFLFFSKFWYFKMKRLTHRVRSSDSDIESHILQGVQNRLVIKTHRALDSVVMRLCGLQSELYDKTVKHTRFALYSRIVMFVGFSTGYLVTFIYGAWQISEGIIGYGVMVAFLQLVSQIQRPVALLASLVPKFTSAATASERVDELFELEVESSSVSEIVEAPIGVRIRSVDFCYEAPANQIFRDFSYDFTPKSRTVVTGESGVGKTTLFRLLLSLVKPQKGVVELYNDVNSLVTDVSTRANFVYVPQGNSLMSGTIRENLLLGNESASEQMIEKAIHTAAAEFVYELIDGLDTICGEGGGVLSEGQAQRIAIARALLCSGSIMLFDELSSALDSQTERLVVERLLSGYNDKTMIFISHSVELFVDFGCNQCLITKL